MERAYSDDFPPAYLYQRHDEPGGEIMTVGRDARGWRLAGKVAIASVGRGPASLAYDVRVDERWHTRVVQIDGTIDGERIESELRSDGAGRWTLDGAPQPQVDGAIDIDLEFTPATNLLAIRRLEVDVGQGAEVRAAWVRLRPLRLEILEQRYRRTAPDLWSYHAMVDGEPFSAELQTDARGMVVRYGELWTGGTGAPLAR